MRTQGAHGGALFSPPSRLDTSTKIAVNAASPTTQPKRPRPNRSRAASANPVPATIHTRQGIRSWPPTSGRHDCAAPCRTETRAPACTPRTAPTTRRSAPGAARRTQHRRRRSRTPGPPATPTPPADHTQARHGKAVFRPHRPPRLQNPQPMSELRNHPRKLTPNSATFTRTGLRSRADDSTCGRCDTPRRADCAQASRH